MAGINSEESEPGLLECEKIPLIAYDLETLLADGLSEICDNQRAATLAGYLEAIRPMNFAKLTQFLEAVNLLLINHRIIEKNPDGSFSNLTDFPEDQERFDSEIAGIESKFYSPSTQFDFGSQIQLAAARYIRENYELFFPRINGYQVTDLYAHIR